MPRKIAASQPVRSAGQRNESRRAQIYCKVERRNQVEGQERALAANGIGYVLDEGQKGHAGPGRAGGECAANAKDELRRRDDSRFRCVPARPAGQSGGSSEWSSSRPRPGALPPRYVTVLS